MSAVDFSGTSYDLVVIAGLLIGKFAPITIIP
jgi:hypothetical protein